MGKILGIVGYSGSGKTTLIEALLLAFSLRGLKVNVIKHAHHALDLEPKHKDSARFRAAGAAEVLVSSPYGYAIMRDLDGRDDIDFSQQYARLLPADLTLVEGYKYGPHAKLEVWRPETGKPLLQTQDPRIIAVASSEPLRLTVPVLDLNQIPALADFIWERASHAEL